MSRFIRYVTLLTLLNTMCFTRAVIIRHTSCLRDAIDLASYGSYNDSVGRVYYANGTPTKIPAAVIQEDRVLVFTNEPQKIESVEFAGTKYKVRAIKEIVSAGQGTLVYCELEQKLPNCSPLHIQTSQKEALDAKMYKGRVLCEHPYAIDLAILLRYSQYPDVLYKNRQYQCKDAMVLGYGDHYDPKTRKPAVSDDSNSLKAVDACVFSLPGKHDRLYTPFDEESIQVNPKDGHVSVIHKKMQGYVGPDDLGALLVNTIPVVKKNGKTGEDTVVSEDQYLLGFACEAGSKDILNPQKPLYNRVSTFLRLSSIRDLANIKTATLPKGYTTVEGQTLPLNQATHIVSPIDTPEPTLPKRRLTYPTPNLQQEPIKVIDEYGNPAMPGSALINPEVVLSILPVNNFGNGIMAGEQKYQVRAVSELSGEINLVYLTTPVLNVTPLPIFRGTNPLEFAETLGSFFTPFYPPFYAIGKYQRQYSEHFTALYGSPQYSQTLRISHLVGLMDSPSNEVQFTQEERAEIDSDIITDALEVNK